MKFSNFIKRGKRLARNTVNFGKRLTYPETYGFAGLPPRLKKVTMKGKKLI
jgi:hypothetical protein